MRLHILASLVLAVVLVECNHRFLGTNVQRPLVFHQTVMYNSNMFTKRIEYLNYTLPPAPYEYGRAIQGILAYDLTNTTASANVTDGGIGKNFVTLRMKSDRGQPIKFDIYIYA